MLLRSVFRNMDFIHALKNTFLFSVWEGGVFPHHFQASKARIPNYPSIGRGHVFVFMPIPSKTWTEMGSTNATLIRHFGNPEHFGDSELFIFLRGGLLALLLPRQDKGRRRPLSSSSSFSSHSVARPLGKEEEKPLLPLFFFDGFSSSSSSVSEWLAEARRGERETALPSDSFTGSRHGGKFALGFDNDSSAQNGYNGVGWRLYIQYRSLYSRTVGETNSGEGRGVRGEGKLPKEYLKWPEATEKMRDFFFES